MSSVNDAGVSKNYYYDARGNVTNNGERTFTYDQSNQPTAMSGAGTYQYDGNYKRVKAVVTQNGQTKITYSIYSLGGQLLYTDKVTENEKTDYIRAAGQTIAQIENFTVKYMHNDLLGSPVRSTYANSNVSFSEEYTPYGEKRLNPDENKDNVGFTGHVQDDATGLTYMQARYYDTAIGRFLSIDPVGFTPSNPMMFNRYAYANNNPYLYVDPDGHNAITKFFKQTIKHKGNVIEAAVDVGGDVVTVFAPSSTPVDRIMSVVNLVSPVDAGDIKSIKNKYDKIKQKWGGRKGNSSTRAQNEAIGNNINDKGGNTTGGFAKDKESHFPSEGSGNSGGRYSDGSARDADGNPFEVQTVDTKANGTLTPRESGAARDIAERGNTIVACVAKADCN